MTCGLKGREEGGGGGGGGGGGEKEEERRGGIIAHCPYVSVVSYPILPSYTTTAIYIHYPPCNNSLPYYLLPSLPTLITLLTPILLTTPLTHLHLSPMAYEVFYCLNITPFDGGKDRRPTRGSSSMVHLGGRW